MKKIILLLLIFFPFCVSAAEVVFDPANGQYFVGDVFGVDLLLKLADDEECINAVEANIIFDKDKLSLMDFSAGESFLSLWIKKPSQSDLEEINKNGNFSFIGGIPGGYCGHISGDIGKSNSLARLYFQAKTITTAQNNAEVVFVDSSQLLYNDGLGTVAQTDFGKASFELTASEQAPVSELEESLSEDRIKPEVFVIELHKDINIFDGEYFIIFNTTDKQSGIDRYEVIESVENEETKNIIVILDRFIRKRIDGNSWKIASSPYRLHDQSLKSVVKVKAIDRAGNEREVQFNPDKEIVSSNQSILVYTWLVFGFLVLLLLLVAVVISKFITNKLKK